VRAGESGLWLLQSSEGFLSEEVDRLGRTVTSVILRAKREPLPAWARRALVTMDATGLALASVKVAG
jgi:hypothetical protein